MLQEKDWKNANILMIFDFVMHTLPEKLTEQIQAGQEKETGFYSLVMEKGGNKQALENVDANWNYDPNNKNIQKELIRQLGRIRKRKIRDE